MANLIIRELDEDVIECLKELATKHHVSMEEEARRILRRAVKAPECVGDLAVSIFGAKNGVDLDLPERPQHDPIVLRT